MQATGYYHHHQQHVGYGGHHHQHSRRWSANSVGTGQEQQQQQGQQSPNYAVSSMTNTYNGGSHIGTHNSQNIISSSTTTTTLNDNDDMQMATTTVTTTQQLLPAPPSSASPSSSRSTTYSTRLTSIASPSPSLALNLYPNGNGQLQQHQSLAHRGHIYTGVHGMKRNGRTHISEDEKEEIRMAFELFDTNKTGKLTYRELKAVMRALDFDVHKAEVKQLMEEHTKDGNTNEVDLEEFMDILMLKYKERDPDEELAKAFKFFDEDGTGKITLKNLRKIARDLGEHIPDEELGAMIEEFDDDQDGGINEAEFQKIMRGDDFDDY